MHSLLDNSRFNEILSFFILKQTIQDCVYLHYRDARPFVGYHHAIPDAAKHYAIDREFSDIIAFVFSEPFSMYCACLGRNEDDFREKLIKILEDEDAAECATQALEIGSASKGASKCQQDAL